MLSLTVSGQGNLFAEFVCATIQAVLPDAVVTLDRQPGANPAGVRVSCGEPARWTYVSAGRGPSAEAAEALANGACAVLSLDSRPEDIQRALDAMLRDNGSYVSPEMLRWMAGATLRHGTDASAVGPAARLTPREHEVLQLVATGQSNSEIGKTLMISSNTVRSHLHALSVKLEATSRTHMLANARALGLPEANGHPGGFQRSA